MRVKFFYLQVDVLNKGSAGHPQRMISYTVARTILSHRDLHLDAGFCVRAVWFHTHWSIYRFIYRTSIPHILQRRGRILSFNLLILQEIVKKLSIWHTLCVVDGLEGNAANGSKNGGEDNDMQ